MSLLTDEDIRYLGSNYYSYTISACDEYMYCNLCPNFIKCYPGGIVQYENDINGDLSELEKYFLDFPFRNSIKINPDNNKNYQQNYFKYKDRTKERYYLSKLLKGSIGKNINDIYSKFVSNFPNQNNNIRNLFWRSIGENPLCWEFRYSDYYIDDNNCLIAKNETNKKRKPRLYDLNNDYYYEYESRKSNVWKKDRHEAEVNGCKLYKSKCINRSKLFDETLSKSNGLKKKNKRNIKELRHLDKHNDCYTNDSLLINLKFK